MVEGVLSVGRIHTSQEVEVEEIFPGLAAERARFDFREVEVAEGEGAEGAEEGAGEIAGAEDQRGLPLRAVGRLDGVAPGVFGAAEEEEAGEVLAIAFDGTAEHARAVDLGGAGGGDGGGIREALPVL